MRLVALVFSVSVHVAAFALVWNLPTSRRESSKPPVEIDLTFKQFEARRVPPPATPPAVQKSTLPPRRAKGSGGGELKSQAPQPTTALPLVPMGEQGEIALLPPSGGEPDAGVGPGTPEGEDTVNTPPPPPAPPTEPQLLSLPRVDYPESARLDELEGVVVLWVTLSSDGHVVSAEVRSSPDRSLSEAARSAILRAQFTPATRDGKAIASRFEYRYRFELH